MQHDAMLGELPEQPARPPFEERFGTAPCPTGVLRSAGGQFSDSP